MIESKYNSFLLSRRTIQNRLQGEVKVLNTNLDKARNDLEDYTEALEIMNLVGILAQDEVRNLIQSLVTKVLQSIFDGSYSFVVEDVVNRNKPESFLWVQIGDNKYSLKEELGGGVVDAVSFALRVVMWALSSPRTAEVIILDEPMKFVSKDKLLLLGQMLKSVSEELDIQFIVISHEGELINTADKGFVVKNLKGTSKVDVVEIY
jgi:DNA repair exonuclease SbcCD ATPase subunit